MEFENLTVEELNDLKSLYLCELKSVDIIEEELENLSLSCLIQSIYDSVKTLRESYEDDLEKINEKIDDGKAGDLGDFQEVEEKE